MADWFREKERLWKPDREIDREARTVMEWHLCLYGYINICTQTHALSLTHVRSCCLSYIKDTHTHKQIHKQHSDCSNIDLRTMLSHLQLNTHHNSCCTCPDIFVGGVDMTAPFHSSDQPAQAHGPQIKISAAADCDTKCEPKGHYKIYTCLHLIIMVIRHM